MIRQHARLVAAMIKYDKGDAPRIQHFMKVHDFAITIARLENVDDVTAYVLEAAAILHDVGIHASEQKYGNCSGKHQEELGPDEARKVFDEVGGYSADVVERVCFLIAHHHTYDNVDGIDWQILLEADFLVNSFEDNLAPEAIRRFRDKVFKTPTGIQLLNDMFAL